MGSQPSKELVSTDLAEYRAQLTRPTTLTRFGNQTRRTQRGGWRRGKGWHLYLGANDVFFDHNTHVHSVQSRAPTTGIAELDLNQNKLFKYVGGLGRTLKDVVFWSFFNAHKMNVKVYLHLDVHVACTIRVTFDQETPALRKTKDVRLTIDDRTPKHYAYHKTLWNVPAGFHTIRVQIVETSRKGHVVGDLHYVKLSGWKSMAVVRERWRPKATHIRFRASTAPTLKAQQFVMTMNKIPSLSAFAPLTAPFGYFGPVLDDAGQATGVNFSMWSFRAAQKANPPPQRTWSHLLALGDRRLTFGEFTHEGTGVKPRFDRAVIAQLKPPYTMALQMSCAPSNGGGFFTTYTSHIWDGDKWKLFAVGRDYTDRRITGITPSAFIEVPGVAERQRTNHIERLVTYEGFVAGAQPQEVPQPFTVDLDDDDDETKVDQKMPPQSKWYALDQIQEQRELGFTNKRWAAEDDHVWASCGGLDQAAGAPVRRGKTMDGQPDWGKPMEQIRDIYKPIPYPEIRGSRTGELDIYVPPSGEPQTCKVYYGKTDGLTIGRLWDRMTQLAVDNGVQTIQVPNADYYRLLLERQDGKYWCLATFRASSN